MAVGSAYAVKQLEPSYRASMHSLAGLNAEYSQVDLQIDWVACIDETTTRAVSPDGYYLYGGHVSQPLTCYQ